MNSTTTRPSTAKGFTEPRNLPRYLADHGRFCLWRYEPRKDKPEEWTKVPYQPKNRTYGADSTNPAHFTNLGTALNAGADFDGLGVGIFDDLAAIDIDHCIDDAGNLSMLAQSVVDLMDTYTEKSPSGTGIRLFFRAPGLVYDTATFYINNRKAHDPREEWPQVQGLEIYIAGMTNKYVTATGDVIRAADVNERTKQVLQIVKRYMERPAAKTATKATAQPVGASLALSDRELIDKAKNAANGAKFSALWDGDWKGAGFDSQSEADLALCAILAYWTGRDFDRINSLFKQSGLMRAKWERNAYAADTIDKAIARCETVYSPTAYDAPPPPEPPATKVFTVVREQEPTPQPRTFTIVRDQAEPQHNDKVFTLDRQQQKPQPKNTQTEAATAPAAKVDLRNHPAFRIAASLRAQGVGEAKIHAQLIAYGENDCVPQMSPEQIEAVYNLVLSYPPKTKLAQMLPNGGRTGKERLSLDNLKEAMASMGYGTRFNQITGEYETIGRTAAGRVMSQDDLLTLLHDALADSYKGVSFDMLSQYVAHIARENEYNPVLETLQAAEWDGRDRLPQLYGLIGIDEADTLSQVLVKKWLMQSVAILFNDPADPYGADGCLVFNGEQGAGKTSLFRHLALRNVWFGEGMAVNDRDKDTTRRIVNTWIAELGEVETTMKSDISALKNFITAPFDKYRLPYGRNDINAPRMTSLCATCNSDRYLIDSTGNRRWWSIPFSRTVPHAELIELDALQLWAQIFAEVAPLEYHTRADCFRLTEEERAALAQRNGDYEKPEKGQTEVEDILARAEAEDLNTRLMTVSDFKDYWPILRPYSAIQIGKALKRCGIATEQRREGNKKGRWAELPIPPTY